MDNLTDLFYGNRYKLKPLLKLEDYFQKRGPREEPVSYEKGEVVNANLPSQEKAETPLSTPVMAGGIDVTKPLVGNLTVGDFATIAGALAQALAPEEWSGRLGGAIANIAQKKMQEYREEMSPERQLARAQVQFLTNIYNRDPELVKWSLSGLPFNSWPDEIRERFYKAMAAEETAKFLGRYSAEMLTPEGQARAREAEAVTQAPIEAIQRQKGLREPFEMGGDWWNRYLEATKQLKEASMTDLEREHLGLQNRMLDWNIKAAPEKLQLEREQTHAQIAMAKDQQELRESIYQRETREYYQTVFQKANERFQKNMITFAQPRDKATSAINYLNQGISSYKSLLTVSPPHASDVAIATVSDITGALPSITDPKERARVGYALVSFINKLGQSSSAYDRQVAEDLMLELRVRGIDPYKLAYEGQIPKVSPKVRKPGVLGAIRERIWGGE